MNGSAPRYRKCVATNGRGGMARLCVDFGNITSSTIACSAPNPEARGPPRSRARAALVVGRFQTANAENLSAFHEGPPAH